MKGAIGRSDKIMNNNQRKAEMITLVNTLGLSEEEALFAIGAAKEFKGCRPEVCTYVAALLSQVADIASEAEEGMG